MTERARRVRKEIASTVSLLKITDGIIRDARDLLSYLRIHFEVHSGQTGKDLARRLSSLHSIILYAENELARYEERFNAERNSWEANNEHKERSAL